MDKVWGAKFNKTSPHRIQTDGSSPSIESPQGRSSRESLSRPSPKISQRLDPPLHILAVDEIDDLEGVGLEAEEEAVVEADVERVEAI